MDDAVLRERIDEIIRSLRDATDLPAAIRRAVWLHLFEIGEMAGPQTITASERRLQNKSLVVNAPRA